MDINELQRMKEETEKMYRQVYNNSGNQTIYEGKLNNIKRELYKIDKLIEIYSHPKYSLTPVFKLLKLEILYLCIKANITEEEYLNMPEEKRFELFHNSVPNGWTYNKSKYPIDEKIKALEEAIYNNSDLKDLEKNSDRRKK